MEDNSDSQVFGDAVQSINESIRSTCSSCGRGAAGLPTPDLDDLEALIQIRDGFNARRLDFSPAMAERFRRFENTIGYLHVLIEGTRSV